MAHASIFVKIDFVKINVINTSSWVSAPSTTYADYNSTAEIPLEFLHGADSTYISVTGGATVTGNTLRIPVLTNDVTVTISNAKAMVTVFNGDSEAIQSITPAIFAAAPGEQALFTVTYNSGYDANGSKVTSGNATLSGTQLTVPVSGTNDVVAEVGPNYHTVTITNTVPYVTPAQSSVKIRHGKTGTCGITYRESSDYTCLKLNYNTYGTISSSGLSIAAVTNDREIKILPNKVQVKVSNLAPYHVTSVSPSIRYQYTGTSATFTLTYASGYTPSDLYSNAGSISNRTLTVPVSSVNYYVNAEIYRGAEVNVELGADGEYGSFETPLNSSYKYSISQQYYTPSEIQRSGIITKVGFKIYPGWPGGTRTLSLHMQNTTQSSFSPEWKLRNVPTNAKVFDGQVTFASDDWTMIQLSTPFGYDSEKHLLLTVNDKTGTSTSGSLAFTTYNSYNSATSAKDSSSFDTSFLQNESVSWVANPAVRLTMISPIEDTPD